MEAITFQALGRVAVEDVPEPEIHEPGDVLLATTAAGLCGSDLHPYLGRERGLDRGTVMGHEVVGRVVEVGAAVRSVKVGDRVVAPFTTSCGACFFCDRGLTARCDRGELLGWVERGRGLQGTQAERIRIPLADTTLVGVPDGMDDALAVLAGDVLSTARYAAELAGVSGGDLVAVVGCGPVGVLAVRAALERGAREVVAVDRVPDRLALAERFGATAAGLDDGPLEAVRARSRGRGADAVIEAVGTAEATRTAASLIRAGGVLAAVGVHVEERLALAPGELYDRNLTYAAGRCPARRLLPDSLAMAERDADLLLELVSHRLPLDCGPEAYRKFADREEGWTKVVFVP